MRNFFNAIQNTLIVPKNIYDNVKTLQYVPRSKLAIHYQLTLYLRCVILNCDSKYFSIAV